MPHRVDEFRAVMHFMTFARMPSLVRKAAAKKGMPSNTVYVQHAVCEALARDLGLPLQELLDELPANRTHGLFGGTRQWKGGVQ